MARMSVGYVIGITVTVVLMSGAVAYSVMNQAPTRDALGCIAGKPLASTTLMLVDATDELNTTHRERLHRDVETLLPSVPAGGKVVVVAVEPEDAPTERFGRCNPGNDGDQLTENVKKLARAWEQEFAAPLRAAVDTLAAVPEADRSPIMEAITAVTQRPDFDRTVPNRTLIVASDMLQNTTAYGQYKGDFAKSFAKSPLASGDQADLAGVTVIIDYFARAQLRGRQGAAHRRFWQNWFRKRGAASVTFVGVANDEESAS